MTSHISLNYSDDPDSITDIDDCAYFRQPDSVLGNPGRYSHNHTLGCNYDEDVQKFLAGETSARHAMAQFALQPDTFLSHNHRILYGGNPKEYTAGWQRIPQHSDIELDYGNTFDALPFLQRGDASATFAAPTTSAFPQQQPIADESDYQWGEAAR